MSTSVPTLSPAGTSQAIVDAYKRAFARAVAGRVVVYRTDEAGAYDVPSASTSAVHRVVVTGPAWWNLSCTCAGGGHVACLHRAVVAFARRHHVYAVRPQAPKPTPAHLCKTCGEPLPAECVVSWHMACVPAGISVLGGYTREELLPRSRRAL